MSEGPPPTSSFEAIGVHIWHLQKQLGEVSTSLSAAMARAATHEDIKGVQANIQSIHDTIATLATKTEVETRHRSFDEKLAALEKRIAESTPSSLMAVAATFATRAIVIATLFGLVFAAVRWADRLPALAAVAKP